MSEDIIKFKSGGEIHAGDPVSMQEVTLDYKAPVPCWTEMVLMQAKPLVGCTPPPAIIVPEFPEVMKFIPGDDIYFVSTESLNAGFYYGKSVKNED